MTFIRSTPTVDAALTGQGLRKKREDATIGVLPRKKVMLQ